MKSRTWGLVAWLAALHCGGLYASDAPDHSTNAPAPARVTVLISDTHLGVGHRSDGSWDPTEDFRWPDALDGFLNYLNAQYNSRVDLVVLGDFLELWQPPASIPCKGPQPHLGCTVQEMTQLVTLVTHEHQHELNAVAQFSVQGDNHVFLVPGNHDSALVIADVWNVVAVALNAPAGRVSRVDNGLWISTDSKIRAEHGHQIGKDVNAFEHWPTITENYKGTDYLLQPWGARFVQSLYNAEEQQYPIIDNIGPESLGARYLIADRGLQGSAQDVAKFLIFNLFETSIQQKHQVLSAPPSGDPTARWNVDYARTLGVVLFKDALDADDPLQAALAGQSADEIEFQNTLASELKTLPAENVLQLCEHAAIHQHDICAPKESSALVQALFNTKDKVIKAHLKSAHAEQTPMAFYIYGHTHQVETPWKLALNNDKSIQVANTGAFQRLIDGPNFKALLKKQHLTPKEALRKVTLEQLPACYSYVVIDPAANPRISVRAWHQEEGKAGRSEPNLAVCRS
jgi:UDP-2,3-diacylglucosamine pyrophosphatase LpxH